MTEPMTDFDGDELVPTFVVSYKIKEDDYGDSHFSREIDDGELIASTAERLADMIEVLTVETISTWGIYNGRGGAHIVSNYDLPTMEKFDPRPHKWDPERWRSMASSSPRLGFQYVEFEPVRIEMRCLDGQKPNLRFTDETTDRMCASMRQAHKVATVMLRDNMTKMIQVTEAAVLERKRQELAKLKAELGEA